MKVECWCGCRKPLGRELLFDEVEDPGVNGLLVGSVRVDQVHAMGEAVALQQDIRLPPHRLVQLPLLLLLTLGGEILFRPDVQRGAGGRVAAASITTRPPSDAPIEA